MGSPYDDMLDEVRSLRTEVREGFEAQRNDVHELATSLERVKACAESSHEIAEEAKANGRALRDKFEARQMDCEKRFGTIALGFWTDMRSVALALIALGGFVVGLLRLVI